MFKLPEGLEAQERPERISKIALYLLDKEPLIYLFIINTDFVPDPTGIMIGPMFAGVSFQNNRIIFIYKPKELEELSREELYFVLVHEAFHIFKKHLERHSELTDPMLRNIAEDMVINYEISKASFEGVFVPKLMNGIAEVPDTYMYENSRIGDEAIETNRIYRWLKSKQKLMEKVQLNVGCYVKIKNEKDESKQFGKIVDRDGYNTGSTPNWKVKRMSKEELVGDCLKQNKKKGDEKQNEITDEKNSNLTPVVVGANLKSGIIPEEGSEEVIGFDVHFDKNEEMEQKEREEEKVEQNLFIEKVIGQAEKMTSEIDSSKSAGNRTGSLISRLKKMNAPVINWKKEFGRKMNVFMSKNSFMHQPVDSFINYPWNPRSRYGILGKYPIMQKKNLQTYIIFAVDTSGSVFSSREELERFFTEVDAAAKYLEFMRKGHVLTIQWDYDIKEGLRIYKPGDWKRFQVYGGGGTGPQSVFKYLNDIFVERGNRYIVNENGVHFATTDKKKLPFLVFLTDGYFSRKVTKRTLGIYGDNEDNVLYFTKSTSMIYPEKNFIKYV